MSNMMKRSALAALALTASLLAGGCARDTIELDPALNPAVVGTAVGQVPGSPINIPGAPLPSLPVLQSDFRMKAGSEVVQFGRDSFDLDDAARQILVRQAEWLRMNPMVRASIEGHADVRQSRNYAFALAERRAAAVRSFLLTQGVLPQQLSTVSWGRERPSTEGAHDASWLQNSRVVTVLWLQAA